ncbi:MULTISPECIES: pentapeptide repeat-containing protein [unclassified Paraburkholderia]|uniref:pentapeptide repeat-containing protein n=1 Tax=unclassified Paraburkholderia TaxID=2615204 RepID=UPI002AB239C6|nr:MULTISPECIES: pentapeptide repeat-containing protein [unclassified Paraburkholderia]
MQMNDADVWELRDRWRAGKYKNMLDAIKDASPDDAWVPLCDSLTHPVNGSPTLDLRGAELRGGKLKTLELAGSHLGFGVFDATQFDEVGFQYAILDGASFRGCEFYLAQMLPVYGDGTDFRHARFRKSFIDYAKLNNVDFSGATLSDGSLNSSEIAACNFSGVLTERSDWRWNTMVRCDFVAARFVECQLRATRFDGARLIDATFENCDLSGVDFRGADLTGVRFLGGTFGDVLQGETTYRTRFDDTPEARRAVAACSTGNQHAVEWCPVVLGSSAPAQPVASLKLKGKPGDVVPQSGWWVSPALGSEQGRRYFKAGETFPDIKSTNWGLVIWSYNSADQG